MNITYNCKEMNNIELYITKSANNDDITLRISVLDNNTTAYDDYDCFECSGDCDECEMSEVCLDSEDSDNLPY